MGRAGCGLDNIALLGFLVVAGVLRLIAKVFRSGLFWS